MDVSVKPDVIKSKTNKYMLLGPVKYLSKIFLMSISEVLCFFLDSHTVLIK